MSNDTNFSWKINTDPSDSQYRKYIDEYNWDMISVPDKFWKKQPFKKIGDITLEIVILVDRLNISIDIKRTDNYLTIIHKIYNTCRKPVDSDFLNNFDFKNNDDDEFDSSAILAKIHKGEEVIITDILEDWVDFQGFSKIDNSNNWRLDLAFW